MDTLIRTPIAFAAASALAILSGPSSALAATTTRAVCQSGCPYHTIQSAIDASASGDTVNIAPGTYFENPVIKGKTLNINGAGQDVTVIDGGFRAPTVTLGAASFSVSSFAHVTMYAVTITHGGSGGIEVNGGSLNLHNSIVISNANAAAVSALSATVTIDGTLIAHNQNYIGGGGAVFASAESHVTITNSTISRNSATAGGGIYVDNLSNVSLSNSSMSDNSTVIVNNVGNGDGGGIYVLPPDIHSPSGTLTVTNSALVNNRAVGEGGGIYGPATITNSIVSGNTPD